jgi:hypothetical protein
MVKSGRYAHGSVKKPELSDDYAGDNEKLMRSYNLMKDINNRLVGVLNLKLKIGTTAEVLTGICNCFIFRGLVALFRSFHDGLHP